MRTEKEIREQINLLSKELLKDKDNPNAHVVYSLGINLLLWVLAEENIFDKL